MLTSSYRPEYISQCGFGGCCVAPDWLLSYEHDGKTHLFEVCDCHMPWMEKQLQPWLAAYQRRSMAHGSVVVN